MARSLDEARARVTSTARKMTALTGRPDVIDLPEDVVVQIICGIVRSLPPPVSIENREYPPSRISVEAWCSLIRILAREAPISSLGAEGKRAADFHTIAPPAHPTYSIADAIKLALEEDIADVGDISSLST